MKTDIHPKYFENAQIKCSCGSVISIGSTIEELKTELCSKCHPFYTGQQKLVDTAGRVDKFEAKRKKAQSMIEETKRKAEEKKKKPEGYIEKVIPQEVIEKAQVKSEGKWGAPLGETPAAEVMKETSVKKAKKTPSKNKASSSKKPSAKKSAAKTPKKAKK